MVKVAHGSVWFKPEVEVRILELMKFQSSALRSAYQAITKHKRKFNNVKNYVKKNYMKDLNQRYVADACCSANLYAVNENVCFGGKKNWKERIAGNLSKKEWQSIRNSQLYSQGDRTKSGNPNIRIVGDKILVNDPAGRGKWLEGKIYLPTKFNPDFKCYSVRLLVKKGKFRVVLSWTDDSIQLPVQEGAIGIDCNPDGVAMIDVSATGNLLEHRYIKKQRIQFASTNKRDYDTGLLAKEVVQYAFDKKKPIVLEKLEFKKKGKKSYKKYNRMKSNFIYRKMLNAIKQRAVKVGVPVIEVQPAFTSVLGQLKYQKMYSLNRHTSAGLVIARRGLGLLERESFTVEPSKEKKNTLNLEERDVSIALTCKAFSWMRESFLRSKPSAFTGLSLELGLKPSIEDDMGEIPMGESTDTTGLCGLINNKQEYERTPLSLGRFVQVS
jgi:IS605 OrfB family transposase